MQVGDNVQLLDKNFHKNFKFFFCSRSTKIKSYILIYNRVIVSMNIVVFLLEHVFKTNQNNYIHLSIKHLDPKLCISKCLKEYLQRREESFQCRKKTFFNYQKTISCSIDTLYESGLNRHSQNNVVRKLFPTQLSINIYYQPSKHFLVFNTSLA